MNDLMEKAELLQKLLISRATGEAPDNREYQNLRKLFFNVPRLKALLPEFVRTYRDLDH